jgi:hypothetical protein
MEENVQWTLGRFVIEDDLAFEGYHFGDLWNGWATPAFTKETVDQMLPRLTGIRWTYDKEADIYNVLSGGVPESWAEDYKGHDIRVNGSVVHVYSIGAYSWTWAVATTQLPSA